MLNFDGTFYEIDLTTYIIIYIVLTIIVTSIQFFSKTIVLDWHSKKKRGDIIKAFRTNKRIRPYIEEYEKIKWFNTDFKGYIYANLGYLCAFIIPYSIVKSTFYLYENVFQVKLTDMIILMIMVYTIIIAFFVPLALLAYLGYISKKAFNEKKLLNKHVTYANTLTAISYYTLLIFIITLPFMISILYNWRRVINSTNANLLPSVIAFCMVIATIFMLLIAKKSLQSRIKGFINMEKVNNFPFMKITTKENIIIEGTVLDIFDDKVLILKDKGIEKIILWDSVNILEIDNDIKEKHKEQMKLDHFI